MDVPLTNAVDPALSLPRCQRALAASHDGFWEFGLRTGSLWFSPHFFTLLGLSSSMLKSARRVLQRRLHPEDRRRFVQRCRAAVAQRDSLDYELRFLDGTGQWRWLRGQARVWTDALGDPQQLCGAVSDVQLEKQALLELQHHRQRLEDLVQQRTAGLEAALALAEQRRQEAETANESKSRFLAHMSHEIRTPLNGVLGMTELALRSAQSPDQRRYLDAAHQSGQALLQMISDVLDLSRIEAGRVEHHPRRFDPAQALARNLRRLMPLARQRRLLLRYDWTGPSVDVVADDGCLGQIITNLLGNAIKFTQHGHVTLLTTARSCDAAGLNLDLAQASHLDLLISVQDTGPGIAADRRTEVFKAFVQGDQSLSRHHGGAGLGLAIALHLAQDLGARLSLDCPAEGGCHFSLALRLPLAPRATEVAATAQAASPVRLAWLVHDDHAAGDWLAARLRRLGWTAQVVLGVPTAAALGGRLDGAAPDLVLVAEQSLVGGVDLGPLRASLPTTCVRLLIRPDWHDPALEARAAALGILPMVTPLTPAQLDCIAADDDIVAEAEAGQRHTEPALRRGAEVLLVEDNLVNQLVGQEFLQALGLQVRLAEDGPAALAACLQQPPALVLMDLQMPGMDGLEATRRLRSLQQRGSWPGAPIVALTAHASPEDRSACRAAGMDGVLTKPLALNTLRHQLARWLPG